ncbi:MAG: hypothetical protein RIB46_09355 [Pseudomonadales bacterium]
MTIPADLCPHVETGTWPWRVELVLDEHLGITDALVRCRTCQRTYLLEMLDWQGGTRVMRVAGVDPGMADRTVHDLGRGSCDVGRAGAQVHQLRSASVFSRWLLWVDLRQPAILAVVPVPQDPPLPSASWRSLPCDGRWVDYARSYTSISKA